MVQAGNRAFLNPPDQGDDQLLSRFLAGRGLQSFYIQKAGGHPIVSAGRSVFPDQGFQHRSAARALLFAPQGNQQRILLPGRAERPGDPLRPQQQIGDFRHDFRCATALR